MQTNIHGGHPNILPFGYGDFGARTVPVSAYVVASGKTIASGSSGSSLKSTSHGLKVGDLIRFTSGTLTGKEFLVLEIIDANTFRVNYKFENSDLPAVADQFSQLRLITSTVSSSGATNTVPGALDVSQILIHQYASTNVTTGAYVQLTASTTSEIKKLQIFDSSGEMLVLAVGGSGSEVNKLYIFPGGNGDIDVSIPAGSRLSIKAVSGTASVGTLLINCIS